jgi:protein associated with RNAse G/E
MAGDVRVIYRKHDGSLHWHLMTRWLGEDEHGVWTGAARPTTMRKGDGPAVILDYASVMLFPHDAWWTASFNDVPARTEIYCDITTPVRWPSRTEVTMIDLDLDVCRTRRGTVELLDEDEFACHQVRYGYPADVIGQAERSAAWLRQRADAGPRAVRERLPLVPAARCRQRRGWRSRPLSLRRAFRQHRRDSLEHAVQSELELLAPGLRGIRIDAIGHDPQEMVEQRVRPERGPGRDEVDHPRVPQQHGPGAARLGPQVRAPVADLTDDTGLGRAWWAIKDTWVLARRSIMRIAREPEQVSDVTIQPVIFVLLFSYVFGSAIRLPGGGSYHQYLLFAFAMTWAGACAGMLLRSPEAAQAMASSCSCR